MKDLAQLALQTLTLCNEAAAKVYQPQVFTAEELQQEADLDKAIEDAEMYANRPSRHHMSVDNVTVQFVDTVTGEVYEIPYKEFQ